MSDALPEDDKTIPDDAELWRRIPPMHIVPDGNRGGMKISSAAFEDHPNGSPMSVILGQEVLASGRDAPSVLQGLEAFSLASITTGLARALEQGVVRRPLPEEPAHAEVFGRKSKSTRRKLAKAANWIIAPDS